MTTSILDWKVEPVSPSSSEETTWVSEDTVLYWTPFHQGDLKLETEISDVCESKAEAAVNMLESLEHLDDLDEWIKEGRHSFDTIKIKTMYNNQFICYMGTLFIC